jgi:flagellar M-ring protein FliF
VNFEQFFSKIKTVTGSLTAGQVASLTVAFLAVVGITIGSAYYLNTPNYSVLFSDLDSEAASSLVTKLKNDKVQYSLDDGNRTIRVPATKVDELRLQYASDGMAGSGHVGFELFDRTAFGVTDFLEHVNYRRALEGELARTISTIGEVAGARVHIAMPQPSLFTGRDQPTKASVILKLRSNRQLMPSTVTAITNLVSASVESLRPESVVIIDNFGRPLSKTENGEEIAEGVPLERQQRIERDMMNKVIGLIEPIVGVGKVRVNVNAKLSADQQESTEEIYDPTPVMRNQQTTTQTGPGVALPATGVAGTRSNLPPDPNNPETTSPAPATLQAAGATPSTNRTETTNFELSKTIRHSVQARGEITKLSVAVLLDDARTAPAAPAAEGEAPAAAQAKPRTPEEVQKIHGLVAAAIGFDAERGDQLTVENISFEEAPVEEMVAPGAWQKYGPQVFEALRIVGIVALGAFALFGVVRPMVRSSMAATPAALGPSPARRAAIMAAATANAGTAPRTVQDIEAELDSQLENSDAHRLPVLTKRMAAMTQREPENAAKLLRSWLSEDR